MICEQSNAIVAASAALAGVIISLLGNWLLSYIKEGYERKSLLRSKYEELAFLVVDSVGDYQKILVAESNRQLLRDSRPASAQKAEYLAHLYFPELKEATSSYLSAIIVFRNCCAHAATEEPDAPWTKALADSPKVEAAQLALEKAKITLDSQIQTYSKTYTLS